MKVTRVYRHADFDEMLSINNTCFKDLQQPSSKTFKEMISVSDVWTAHAGDEGGTADGSAPDIVVGFAIVEPGLDSAYLWEIAVHPAWQGRGIARDIIRDVISYYEMKDYRNVRLHVSVDSAAQKLYYDCGFRVYDIERGYYDANHDALMMRKTFKK